MRTHRLIAALVGGGTAFGPVSRTAGADYPEDRERKKPQGCGGSLRERAGRVALAC
jgi:hypothetical protein